METKDLLEIKEFENGWRILEISGHEDPDSPKIYFLLEKHIQQLHNSLRLWTGISKKLILDIPKEEAIAMLNRIISNSEAYILKGLYNGN